MEKGTSIRITSIHNMNNLEGEQKTQHLEVRKEGARHLPETVVKGIKASINVLLGEPLFLFQSAGKRKRIFLEKCASNGESKETEEVCVVLYPDKIGM